MFVRNVCTEIFYFSVEVAIAKADEGDVSLFAALFDLGEAGGFVVDDEDPFGGVIEFFEEGEEGFPFVHASGEENALFVEDPGERFEEGLVTFKEDLLLGGGSGGEVDVCSGELVDGEGGHFGGSACEGHESVVLFLQLLDKCGCGFFNGDDFCDILNGGKLELHFLARLFFAQAHLLVFFNLVAPPLIASEELFGFDEAVVDVKDDKSVGCEMVFHLVHLFHFEDFRMKRVCEKQECEYNFFHKQPSG